MDLDYVIFNYTFPFKIKTLTRSPALISSTFTLEYSTQYCYDTPYLRSTSIVFVLAIMVPSSSTPEKVPRLPAMVLMGSFRCFSYR